MTKRLFTMAGLYFPHDEETGAPAHGVTNHGIRITSCQWAGRFNASPLDAKNTGRWKTYEEMAKYHGQGQRVRMEGGENGGVDELKRMWPWKPVCLPGIDGRDQL
jgi:hypothetical protein